MVSSFISNIVRHLEKIFQDSILLYFKDESQNHGLGYELEKNFVSWQKHPHDQMILSDCAHDKMQLRIFCAVRTLYKSDRHKKFFSTLNQRHSTPLFFIAPYFEYLKKTLPQEDFYICECPFEIKITVTQNRIEQFSVFNHNNDTTFKKLTWELFQIFLNPKSFDKKEIEKETKKISYQLPKHTIIKSIKKTIQHIQQGDCYLANITHTMTLNPPYAFPDRHQFIEKWFKVRSMFGMHYYLKKKTEKSKDKDKDKYNIGICSYSPERFLLLKNNHILTEPIKGTIECISDDDIKTQAFKLWKNKKEMYEHTLVVDLLRHDLNSFCLPGSVHVHQPFFIKKCHQILQMQSTIFGRKKSNTRNGTILFKMLPAGSVTGTPKKIVCEIIRQQETKPRGYYTGVAGLIEVNGDFESSVLIRSIYSGKLNVYCGIGAGITSLSNPNLELEEFELKLKSFFN